MVNLYVCVYFHTSDQSYSMYHACALLSKIEEELLARYTYIAVTTTGKFYCQIAKCTLQKHNYSSAVVVYADVPSTYVWLTQAHPN